MEAFIGVALFFILLLSHKFYQYVRCENIDKKIKWIAEKSTNSPDYNGCYGSENLTYYINTRNARNNDYNGYRINGMKIETFPLTIPDECQIDFASEQERLYVSEILESYKRNLIDTFFKEDRTTLSQKHKAIYKLRNLDYFMFSLLCYLNNCVDYDSYLFCDKVYKDREYTDETHFECQLTEYGRICYKIYLVVSMYCENNDYAKPLISQAQSNHIIEYIKTNKVNFWRYRP